ncbi:hypothetical protein [Alicyclobacillus ferrooxydans]|uniref:hypothetical protein n=1 Tax=Alicyclobacillus ferrooxydans TaxID=471514 RepID=UPI0006D5804E|nr:hypothetical protein [Alicyclobacillus ferrooxydans]
MPKQWLQMLIPAVITGVAVTGCGVSAQNSNSPSTSATANAMSNTMSNSASGAKTVANTTSSSNRSPSGQASGGMGNSTSMSNSMGSSAPAGNSMMTTSMKVGTPLNTSDILVGAAASPPSGNGNGTFVFNSIGKGMATIVPLAKGANAFKVGITGNTAYVPTLQGTTYVVNLQSHKVTGQFATPQGARIANIANQGKLLLITGSHSVTAYSLPTHTLKWTLNMGGNALAVADNGYAYLSGNMMKKTVVIDLSTGKEVTTIPVGSIEDSVYDRQTHTLWLADWTNGDMTIVDTRNNQVITTIQKAEGGGFSMANMMGSTGGFMQLTVGPNGHHVYAASFSGNIMVYSAKNNTFEKDIPVLTGSKLSGIAVDPSDKYIYTTVENKQETVAVSLQTDQVASTMHGVLANRWAVIHN